MNFIPIKLWHKNESVLKHSKHFKMFLRKQKNPLISNRVSKREPESDFLIFEGCKRYIVSMIAKFTNNSK